MLLCRFRTQIKTNSEKVNQVVEDGKAEIAQMHFSPKVEQ